MCTAYIHHKKIFSLTYCATPLVVESSLQNSPCSTLYCDLVILLSKIPALHALGDPNTKLGMSGKIFWKHFCKAVFFDSNQKKINCLLCSPCPPSLRCPSHKHHPINLVRYQSESSQMIPLVLTLASLWCPLAQSSQSRHL